MRMTKQFFLMVAALLLVAAGCTDSSTKPDYIGNYETWMNKLKAGYKEYKREDWSKAEVDFKSYAESGYNRFKDQFTEEERERVDKLTGQYYALLAKYKTNQIKAILKSFMNKAGGLIEELKKE